MGRHLFFSALFVVPGFLSILFISKKWNVGKNTIRNFTVMAFGSLAAIMFLSESAVVSVTRCLRDPTEFCEYNGNVPAMAVIAGGFFLICVLRSFTLYGER